MAKRKIQELTTGVHDFESLIKDKTKKYVDKTNLLYELASEKTGAQYFISRPRRFGKSLMLTTLQAMFEGRRDLFKGLAIHDKPWEGWTAPTPVYSFTMSNANGDSYAEVKEQLDEIVEDLYEQAGLAIPTKGTIPGKFSKFLKAAAELSPTKKIVILVDEYDEPVAGFLDDIGELKRVRKLLHDFYE
ncbi:MAG: AAA family ATPase, partial [Kiritimatiellae bacterium]|nr:AAA family ATPase [Kiritimatiellia bacterium]